MLICDRCKKVMDSRRDLHKLISLAYDFQCSAWQRKEFDICGDCRLELHIRQCRTEYDFINNRDYGVE